MTWLMQMTDETSSTCCFSGEINWAVLAVLLQVLTLVYLAYAFGRTTKNQTRIEEYLKRQADLNKKDTH